MVCVILCCRHADNATLRRKVADLLNCKSRGRRTFGKVFGTRAGVLGTRAGVLGTRAGVLGTCAGVLGTCAGVLGT
ncbi:MAG: hypothetical protein LBU34_00135, partial [Planctomycetaceae bacterium]|nr:hypothetical protein [Planctomycetaceae bacterium]